MVNCSNMVISHVVPILCSDSAMLDKHLTFYLFVFRVSIVVAILESVASKQTVLCRSDSKGISSCACLACICKICETAVFL